MGQKIHPNSVRLGITQRSSSHWYADKTYYSFFLCEDRCINTLISKFCNPLIISDIILHRRLMNLRIRLYLSKFNLSKNIIILDTVFGTGQKYLEKLRQALQKARNDFRRNYLVPCGQWESFSKLSRNAIVNIFVCIWKNQEVRSSCIRRIMVSELEKRVPFRLVIKSRKELGFCSRHTLGIRIQVSGRVNGAEIARVEKIYFGSIPLLTFSANLDFSSKTAHTVYGALGVKVWILNHPTEVRTALI
jgi:small subunit ribosomal protein S3